MTRFVLIRPGSTEFDEQGRIKGNLDIPLSPQGETEAAQAAEQLRGLSIDYLYTSPCQFAVETAEMLASVLGVRVKRLERLVNLDHGLWQGESIRELKRKHPKVYRHWRANPDRVRPPGGETVGSARQRVRAIVDKLIRKHTQGTIAIVAPEPIVSLLHSELTRECLRDLWKAEQACGNWEVVEVEPTAEVASSIQ